MKRWLQKLIKALAYCAAAIVIVLAIAVGIFRLMLPRLPEYQEEIKGWASAAIGMRVDFTGMNARWRLTGPELSFFGAELSDVESGSGILTAEEVSIGVGLLRLLADRELVVDRVSIHGAHIELSQDQAGQWTMQGIPADELTESPASQGGASGGNVEIVGEDISVSYSHPDSGQIVPLLLQTVVFSQGDRELRFEADIDLQAPYGDSLEIAANRLVDGSDDDWHIFVEGDSIDLAGWSRLRPAGLPEVRAGVANFSVWADLDGSTIRGAAASIDIDGLVSGAAGDATVSVEGRFEYSREFDGWLLAGDQLRVSTPNGAWPETDWHVRLIENDAGEASGLRADARYANLDDFVYVRPWLPAQGRQWLDEYEPGGVLRELNVEVTRSADETVEFDVSADLENIGVAAVGAQPGVRSLSGSVRADRDGGRIEIDSTGLLLDLGEELPQPVLLDEAFGTVIWRRNADDMIVLSDSVRLRNADFDSQMSLQVSVPGDDTSPTLDFESTWEVTDVSTLQRYLPSKRLQPKLRQWLSDALVSGRLSNGTTRFAGRLDEFPFDNDEGVFRIEARLEDAVLRYSPRWPAPQFRHADIVVDNMRLYSTENSAVNVGNVVEDASIEIADLRKPVLTIDAFATGTLETIRSYASQSPINNVLGGQLDRVTVSGDASFDLEISYPIQDKENYDFTTRIRPSGGTVQVARLRCAVDRIERSYQHQPQRRHIRVVVRSLPR